MQPDYILNEKEARRVAGKAVKLRYCLPCYNYLQVYKAHLENGRKLAAILRRWRKHLERVAHLMNNGKFITLKVQEGPGFPEEKL